jgi:hypothetical protein
VVDEMCHSQTCGGRWNPEVCHIARGPVPPGSQLLVE